MRVTEIDFSTQRVKREPRGKDGEEKDREERSEKEEMFKEEKEERGKRKNKKKGAKEDQDRFLLSSRLPPAPIRGLASGLYKEQSTVDLL